METTYMRGFSNTFTSVLQEDPAGNFQFTEGSELERAWKLEQRQRRRQQQERIWQDFVTERDVLLTVHEDPYQFLQQLPHSHSELLRLVDDELGTQLQLVPPGSPTMDPERNLTGRDSEVFQIYDDKEDEQNNEDKREDNDDEDQEDNPLNESIDSARTVCERERSESPQRREEDGALSESFTQKESINPSVNVSGYDSRSNENINDKMESSTYCAKVKSLRQKIKEELEAIASSLEGISLCNLEPEQIRKLHKRSAEFCGRFHRIYEYQLQRQIQVIQRHNSSVLPLAKHTQFHSQMTRVGSLHQGLLQALQVFHKSLEQTQCVGDSCAQLRALLLGCRAASDVSRDVTGPAHCPPASRLYDDMLEVTCAKVESAVRLHSQRVSCETDAQNLMSERGTACGSVSVKRERKGRRGGDKVMNSKLAMYSIDTTGARRPSRTNFPVSKVREESKPVEKPDAEAEEKAGKKKSRRPLREPPRGGRAAGRGGRGGEGGPPPPRGPPRARSPPAPSDQDVATLVQTVDGDGDVESVGGLLEGFPLRFHRRARRSPPPPRARPPRRGSRSPPAGRSPRRPRSPPPTTAMPRSPVTAVTLVPNVKYGKEEQAPFFSSSPMRGKSGFSKSPPRSKVEPYYSEHGHYKFQGPWKPKSQNDAPAKFLNQLCDGDGGHTEFVSGAKNARLVCVNDGSPRPRSPHILKVLEKTKAKASKRMNPKAERMRLAFDIPATTSDAIFKYRTKFLQHMLTSPLYANCAVSKPWEVVGSVSEQIVDELLASVAKEMELKDLAEELYWAEIL